MVRWPRIMCGLTHFFYWLWRWLTAEVLLPLTQFGRSVWTWLNANAGAFALVVTLVTSLVLAIKYLSQRRIEIRDRRFRTYHSLIRDFVQPQGGATWLDRQIAIAYEFRNFPEYYDVTFRILRDLRAQWGAVQPHPAGRERLLSEMGLTLAFVQWHRLPWIKRVFRRKPRG